MSRDTNDDGGLLPEITPRERATLTPTPLLPTPAEPAAVIPQDGASSVPEIPSAFQIAAQPPSQKDFVLSGPEQPVSNEFLTRVLPHRIGSLTREWRQMKAQWDSPSNYVLGAMNLSRDYVLNGNQTDIGTNAVSAIAEPFFGPLHALFQINVVRDLLGIPPNTPVDPDELASAKKERKGIVYPKHMNKFLFNIVNQEWDEKEVNLGILRNPEKPGLIGTIVGFATQIAMSVATNPIGAVLPVTLEAGIVGLFGAKWGERLAFGLSEKALAAVSPAQRILSNVSGKATAFLLENAVTTAAWSAPEIGLEALMGQTPQALQDLHDLGNTFTNFAFLTAGAKLFGAALNKGEVKAWNYLKRRHQTMSPEAAADMKEAAVNQTSRGHDAQQDIQMRKALNDQAARMQGEMDAEGISADDANSVLNKGDEEIKADLEAKTKIQDEAERAFLDAKIQPENAVRLSDQLEEIAPDIKGLERGETEKNVLQTQDRQNVLSKQLNTAQKELESLSKQPSATEEIFSAPLKTLRKGLQEIDDELRKSRDEQAELTPLPRRETRRRLKELKTKIDNLERRAKQKEVDFVERSKVEKAKIADDLNAAKSLLSEVKQRVLKEKIKPPVTKKKAAAFRRDKIKRLQQPLLEEIKTLELKREGISNVRKFLDTTSRARLKRSEIMGIKEEQQSLKGTLRGFRDKKALFDDRAAILKSITRLLDRLGIKVEDSPEEKLKAATDDWVAKNEARFEAKQNLNANELLRHFVNSKERFSKADLDKFVLQQGPAREEFAAERGKPTPFVPGRDIENPSTLLEDRFTNEDVKEIFDDAEMDEQQQQEWEDLQQADENRETLRSALKAAAKCLRETPT